MNNENQTIEEATTPPTPILVARATRPRSPAFCATNNDAYSTGIVNTIHTLFPPTDVTNPTIVTPPTQSPKATARRQ